MSTYRLSELLAPRSIAVIGGSERETSVGRAVLKNLREGGFAGPVSLVNEKYAELLGVSATKSVSALQTAPDLAIITTPAHTIPDLVDQIGQLGCKAAVIISAGLGRGEGSCFEQARLNARRYGLRISLPATGTRAPSSCMSNRSRMRASSCRRRASRRARSRWWC